MNYEKIILVTRKTRLEGLVERFNTKAQAQFYIEQNAQAQAKVSTKRTGGEFTFYEREHQVYHQALAQLRAALQRFAKLQVIEREFLPNFLFAPNDLIVTIGIDGLVVNTAKYLTGQPLIAVNPDPQHIDGILLPFTVQNALPVVHRALRGEFHAQAITMAEARLNDGQRLLAFNDLFIGVRSHVSARYRIETGGREERHSSSGIIVSTGAGSTGWLSSLFNMAQGMIQSFGAQEFAALSPQRLPWDTDRLLYVVREPFISKTSGASIVCGESTHAQPLRLESEMPEGGVIFSDGVESDYLAFNAGATATIGIAEQHTQLVIG